MKFFLTYRIYLILFLFGLLLFSCATKYRYTYLNPKELNQIKEVYLISFSIKNQSQNSKNQVIYYSTSFIRKTFIDSFVQYFNNNDYHQIISLLSIEQQEDIVNQFTNIEQFSSYGENILPESLKAQWIRQNHTRLQGDGYLTIEFETSTWEQDARGFFKLYNPNGIVVWREEIDHFSPYIIFDQESPYLIRNKDMILSANSTTHYDELKKVYKILAQKMVKSFEVSLNKFSKK